MKRSLTLAVQAFIVLLGAGVLFFLLWEPPREGANAHANLYQVYFNDPFLAYAYATSVAFFTGLYQAFQLAGYIRRNEPLKRALDALRIIRACALIVATLAVAAMTYLSVFMRTEDDIAGGMALGLLVVLGSIVTAAGATVYAGRLRRMSAALA